MNDTDWQTHRLTVLGAGVMGTNIATVAVGHGVPVVLYDVDDAALTRARAQVRSNLRHAQMMGVLPPDRPAAELTTTLEIGDGADATVVIEAVTEQAVVKTKALASVCKVVPAGIPLITNTSGIPIDELADWVGRPEDLLGTHFMNPTYLIKMVEVVRGRRTGEPAMAAAQALLTALGREVVVVRDAPGFVTSRLLHPMINSAARIVAAGTAGVEDVDLLMRGCLGHPTGPLRTADLIGIDNLVDSLAAIHERTGDESCRPCELLLEKVAVGDLGRKTGRGFYEYGEA